MAGENTIAIALDAEAALAAGTPRRDLSASQERALARTKETELQAARSARAKAGPVIDLKAVEVTRPAAEPAAPPAKAGPEPAAAKQGWWQSTKNFFGFSQPAAAPAAAPTAAAPAGPTPPAPAAAGSATAAAPKALQAPTSTALVPANTAPTPAVANASKATAMVPVNTAPAAEAAKSSGWLSKAGSFLQSVANNPYVAKGLKVLGPIGSAFGAAVNIGEAADSKNSTAQRVASGAEAAGYGMSLLYGLGAAATGLGALVTGGLAIAATATGIGVPLAVPLAAASAALTTTTIGLAGTSLAWGTGTFVAAEVGRTTAAVLGAGDPTGVNGVKPGIIASAGQGIKNLVTSPAPDPVSPAAPTAAASTAAVPPAATDQPKAAVSPAYSGAQQALLDKASKTGAGRYDGDLPKGDPKYALTEERKAKLGEHAKKQDNVNSSPLERRQTQDAMLEKLEANGGLKKLAEKFRTSEDVIRAKLSDGVFGQVTAAAHNQLNPQPAVASQHKLTPRTPNELRGKREQSPGVAPNGVR